MKKFTRKLQEFGEKAAQVQRAILAEAQIDGVALRPLRELVELGEGAVERGHAAGGGEPVGEAQAIVREPVQRVLHLRESRRRLHEIAQRDLSRQIFRRPQ